MSIRNYVSIARPDHWIKNIFIIPGVAFAWVITVGKIGDFALSLFLGFCAVCMISSANYVINEWLDANFDKFHPVKKNRASVSGNLNRIFVYCEYVGFALVGLFLSSLVSVNFLLMSLILLLMGIFYNWLSI